MFEAGHECGDSVPEFSRPLEASGHLGHVLVQRHRPGLASDTHMIVIDDLDCGQLRIHHLHHLGVVGLEVLLDERSLQQRTKHINQLQTIEAVM